MSKWTSEQIPDQSGRTAIVTGANSGLGLSTARELARHGATVVLACRNLAKGQTARRAIETSVPKARVRVAELDLGSLASVEEFAGGFAAEQGEQGFDLLINNAGVMAPPRRETSDGFELQLGTNLLGHFALTGRLIGLMEGHDDARVVTLSSNAHKMGRIQFDDLQSERGYRRWNAYAQSKLGDLMFALELDRRLRAADSTVKSVAAHPGYAATNLQTAAPPALDRIVMQFTNVLVAQSADMGALPDALRGDVPRPARRLLRGTGRDRRVPRAPEADRAETCRARRGNRGAAVVRLRRAHGRALRARRRRSGIAATP